MLGNRSEGGQVKIGDEVFELATTDSRGRRENLLILRAPPRSNAPSLHISSPRCLGRALSPRMQRRASVSALSTQAALLAGGIAVEKSMNGRLS